MSSRERSSHVRVEELLVEAMTAEDPVAKLREAENDPELTSELKDMLRSATSFAGGDGLRLNALLVARLRFERLIRGSAVAESWFEAEPESFVVAFGTYHRAVPMSAFFPKEEAKLFEDWVEKRSPRAH